MDIIHNLFGFVDLLGFVVVLQGWTTVVWTELLN